MSTSRTIRIEDNGLTRTIVRPVGPAGPAGAAGTPGSMTGPAGATADAIAVFNGPTGNLLKDSTVLVSDLATASALATGLAGKVNVEAGKGLSQENFTTALRDKLNGLATGTYRGGYPSLGHLQAAVPIGNDGDYAYVEVSGSTLKVYHWDSENSSWQTGVDLSGKVDKVTGKGLSTNDFTDFYKGLVETAVQTSTLDAAIDGLDTAIATFTAHIASPYNPHPSTYAGIGVDEGVTAQAVANGATVVSTAFSTAAGFNEASNDCVSNRTNNRVEITRTGRYKVDWSLSIAADTNNIQLYGGVMVGGSIVASGQASTKIGTAADRHYLGGTAIITIASVAGSDGHVQLGLWHGHGGTVNLTPSFAGLVVVRLGDSA